MLAEVKSSIAAYSPFSSATERRHRRKRAHSTKRQNELIEGHHEVREHRNVYKFQEIFINTNNIPEFIAIFSINI